MVVHTTIDGHVTLPIHRGGTYPRDDFYGTTKLGSRAVIIFFRSTTSTSTFLMLLSTYWQWLLLTLKVRRALDGTSLLASSTVPIHGQLLALVRRSSGGVTPTTAQPRIITHVREYAYGVYSVCMGYLLPSNIRQNRERIEAPIRTRMIHLTKAPSPPKPQLQANPIIEGQTLLVRVLLTLPPKTIPSTRPTRWASLPRESCSH